MDLLGAAPANSELNVKHRVIRGTQGKPLPLLPSGPGGVCSRLLHGARHLTTFQFSRCWGGTRTNPGIHN